MARFKAQYERLGFTFEDEQRRQQQALAQRVQIRKQRHERTRKMRMMYQDEQERKTQLERASGLQAALQKVSQAAVSVGGSEEESDELLRLLREWAASREKHHIAVEAERLATTCVGLDDKLLSALILKLV